MTRDFVNEKNSFVCLLVFLLVFFIPSSSLLGGFQLWYVITIGVVYFAIFRNKLVENFITRSVLNFIIVSFILLFISLLISGVNFGSIQDFNEILRLLGVSGVFYLMYCSYSESLNKKIIIFFQFFLLSQLFICFLQGNNAFNNVLGLVWNTERVWDLRRTGSFSNPNILSIFCISAFSYIFFRITHFQKFVFGIVVFAIILFTSSKTGLVSFLLLINLNVFLIKAKFNFRQIIVFVLLLFFLFYFFIVLLYMYQDEYPYLAQLVSYFDNDFDPSQVKSYGDRQVMWENALNVYSNLSVLQQIFGIGPAKDTSLNIIDNDFLTILVKMGLAGILLYFVSLLVLLMYLFKNKVNLGAKVLISVLCLFLLASGSAATFTAWHLSLMLFLLLGICCKEINEGH